MANYHPFAPNGFSGIHQGAAIVFFAYIGFDAISTAAEETVNRQRNLPIGILGELAVCTVIYVVVGAVLTGMVPYRELARSADPLAYALQAAGFQRIGWIVALGAAVSMAAVLLVFQLTTAAAISSRWRATACCRNGRHAFTQSTAHPARDHRPDRHCRRAGLAHRRRRGDVRPDEHRDAVRLRAGLYRRRRAPLHGPGAAAAVQGAPCRRRCAARGARVRVHHGGPAAPGVGTVRHLAAHRRRDVTRRTGESTAA